MDMPSLDDLLLSPLFSQALFDVQTAECESFSEEQKECPEGKK